MKASKLVKSVLVGTPVFLAGCGGCYPAYTVYEERAYADGVPVVHTMMPGYHYSPFYHGYVPIIVPLGGYSGGNTYINHYNSLPPSQRNRYAAPVTTSSRHASPVSSSGGAAAAAATGTSSRGPTASPVTTSRPSTATSRGIAGSVGTGSVSS